MSVMGLNRRSPLLPTVVIAAVVVIVVFVFTQVWTDKLWFDSVGFSGVFSTELVARVVLFLVFGTLTAGVLALNMWLAFRSRPPLRRGPDSALIERYRELLEANFWVAMVVPSLAIGLLSGVSASGSALTVLAFINRVPFGQTERTFGLDQGFYVFEYPVWQLLASYALTVLGLCLIAAVVMHFATGALIPGRGRGAQMPAGTRIHLAVLTGLLLVAYGLSNLLDRYGFLVDEGTLFTGLHFTDDHARIGARLVLAVIAFIVAGLFFATAFLRRWLYPVVGLVLMVVSSLILSLIYPAVVQSFTVRPNEPDKEAPYIQQHIDATRSAFGLSSVEVEDYAAVTQVRPGQLKQDAEALPGIRLMDPAVVSPTFDQLQQVRGYYSFPDVLSVDRYQLDGVERDVVVAARELNLAGLPDQNWNNVHTVYTHGYGLVAAYGNRRQTMGEPEWIEYNIPPVGRLGTGESRIYFGEQSDQFVVVGRESGQQPIEFDTPGGGDGAGQTNVYDGKGGVPIGDFFTRALYASRFMDLNLLLSDRVNSASRILYDRTPKERVEQVAPWLTTDSDLYPAIVDGRLVWIVDAYTTSSTYPNSELMNLRQSSTDTQTRSVGAQLDENINYIRNSVKAVVDAYDGTVTLYAWDPTDPILQTYMKVFPGTVQPREAITPDLMSHLRYPEDLFKVQREVLGRYHMTNPRTWYAQSDLWQVPVDPVKSSDSSKEPPYYLSIKWPGDAQPMFSLTAVFVPRGRSNLASYLAVVSDPASPDYGKLRVLRMSDSHQIDGPGQTFNAINNDQTVAEMLRPFLNQGSSAATYGNLLTLPMGNGLLYVAPVYTMRQGTTGSYPALRFVVVRFGEHVGIGATLQEALDSVFAGDAGANTGEGPTPSGSPTSSPTTSPTTTPTTTPGGQVSAAVTALLKKASTAFDAADAALRSGDLAEYQKQINLARTALKDALKAMGR